MRSFAMDMTELERNLKVKKEIPTQPANRLPYEINQTKFTRIAFDMFQNKFDRTVWELSEDENGKCFIKRADLDENPSEQPSEYHETIRYSRGVWMAANHPVVLYAMSIPVRAFDSKNFKYNEKTAQLFARSLIDKITKNSAIAKKYIQAMTTQNREALANRCRNNLMDDETRSIFSWLIEEK